MATQKQSKSASSRPLFGKKFICVWSLPRDSKPIVRVEVDNGQIRAGKLFEITCDTIGLYKRSRQFFGLFRGIAFPSKKYGSGETLYLPYKIAICIQRWSFDLTTECRVIKTDPEALRLLALNFMFNIESGRVKLTKEQESALSSTIDPTFVCYKTYVEEARKLEGYDSYVIPNATIAKNVKIVNSTFQTGTKIDMICTPKKLIIMSKIMEVSIPWRKIRRFAEIDVTKSISLEIFLAEDRAFAWLELQCAQGTLLLQIIAEYIGQMKTGLEKPEFRQPKWVKEPERTNLTWSVIKKELFGIGKEKRQAVAQAFDDIDSDSSDEEKIDESMIESVQSLTSSNLVNNSTRDESDFHTNSEIHLSNKDGCTSGYIKDPKVQLEEDRAQFI